MGVVELQPADRARRHLAVLRLSSTRPAPHAPTSTSPCRASRSRPPSDVGHEHVAVAALHPAPDPSPAPRARRRSVLVHVGVGHVLHLHRAVLVADRRPASPGAPPGRGGSRSPRGRRARPRRGSWSTRTTPPALSTWAAMRPANSRASLSVGRKTTLRRTSITSPGSPARTCTRRRRSRPRRGAPAGASRLGSPRTSRRARRTCRRAPGIPPGPRSTWLRTVQAVSSAEPEAEDQDEQADLARAHFRTSRRSGRSRTRRARGRPTRRGSAATRCAACQELEPAEVGEGPEDAHRDQADPEVSPSGLKARAAIDTFPGLPLADRAVDEEGPRRDQEQRPEARELSRSSHPGCGRGGRARGHEGDPPRGRVGGLLLVDGASAEEAVVDRGGALPGVDDAEEEDEGDEEGEGKRVRRRPPARCSPRRRRRRRRPWPARRCTPGRAPGTRTRRPRPARGSWAAAAACRSRRAARAAASGPGDQRGCCSSSHSSARVCRPRSTISTRRRRTPVRKVSARSRDTGEPVLRFFSSSDALRRRSRSWR